MKKIKILSGMLILSAILIITGVLLIRHGRQSTSEKAEEKLRYLLSRVTVTELTPRKAAVDFTDMSLAASLPDISEYPLCVAGEGSVDIEIFASPEKAGTGADGWLTEAAESFNAEHFLTRYHKSMSVSVRCVSSGMGADYITSGAYLPDAYTPSNEMWGLMASADGAKLSTQYSTETLVQNTAGVLIPKNFPEMSFSEILQACTDQKLAMGYTYPYTSSTGLNFLISALYSFDEGNPLSSQAVEKFQEFQASVPFVCYTTQQMQSAMQSGSLTACVTEYQIYHNDTALQKQYQFIPFGIRHDNPLYAVGDLNPEKQEVLQRFTAYCLSEVQQKKAADDGFNQMDYHQDFPALDSVTLRNAQKLWKKEKDTGRPCAAVFAADISGSMNGDALNRLKISLIQAANSISEENYIGLISYNSQVYLNLPVGKFDLNQRSCFTGAVQDLSASGATCTYDAVLQGLQMLLDVQKQIPDIRPVLFVLSDGETNTGNTFADIQELVSDLEIPVYTIGYHTSLSELEQLSALNEAACIHADSQDVIYQLRALFHAQM